MRVFMQHKDLPMFIPKEPNRSVHSEKVIKNRSLFLTNQALMGSYEIPENELSELNCYAFYTRIHNSVLRLNYIDTKSGGISFDFISSFEWVSNIQIQNMIFNLTQNFINFKQEKRGIYENQH